MKYLIGNWKSNYTIEEALTWIEAVKANEPSASQHVKVILCPAFTHLLLFRLNYPNLTLGAQTISGYPAGAYTGMVSSYMLKGLVSYAIIGHSERRNWAKESQSDVANQVTQALDMKIIPIVAVDKNNWFSQLSLIEKKDLDSCIVAYEPPESIGQNDPSPLDQVVETAKRIRVEYSPRAIIYGGSIKNSNIKEYITHPSLDGVLLGSASLDAKEWINMINASNQALKEIFDK